MVIRLLTSLAGPLGAWAAGDLYECDESTARRMVGAGYAVPADLAGVPVVVETTEAPSAPERALSARGRRK